MSQNNPQDIRVRVRGLWKVFGPDERMLLNEDWVQKATKTEVQERTGHVIAVRDVSFHVRTGEVFVVMGLSGSGKSTLIRCLIRLIEPSEGTVEFDGENVLDYDQQQIIEFRRHKTGMVFQHYGLFPHRNVIDNVAYGLEVQGIDRETRYEKACETLELVGLKGWESSYPDELSGGMQQRVGIARALTLDPGILLMDEPFSGLDPLIRRQMQNELIKLQSRLHKTIVFITHDLLEALKLGDRIAILRDGAIIQQGTPEQIVMAPVDDYVAEFVKDISKARVMRVEAIMHEPPLVLDASQSPRAAADLMREREMTVAFVVSGDRRVHGLMTLDRAIVAATSCQEACSGCEQVSADTSVQNLIPVVARTDQPIAIVDEQGRLLGAVDRPTVLDSLAESQAERAY
jgi:glycine betaine/proline transport system ATP-binding protein